VADRGAGVDDALKPHIFEQGTTSKPSHGHELAGSDHGIGLYLVAGYVNRAGGSIEVTDNVPQGTIFSVFIPLQAATATGVAYAK
jgi:two-component system cit operon sensor histidine kinase CitA